MQYIQLMIFSNQGSSHRPCNSDVGPKTSHFITECYVRKNATVKELPPGLNPGAPTYCIYVPKAKKNESVVLPN